MKVVYASRTGNVECFIDKLGIEATKIVSGNEKMDEDFILFTYTDGCGEVPFEVQDFLKNNADHLKGVISSGDMGYGEENFCHSGQVISDEYHVPYLYHFELAGSDEDVKAVKDILVKMI